MITHFCKAFHYTPDYVLQMPARRFFAMRIEQIELERRERADLLFDLCDVSAISLGDSKYLKELKHYYRTIKLTKDEYDKEVRHNNRIFDASDPKESKKAAQALAAAIGGVVVG
jgi:hypothetical protein